MYIDEIYSQEYLATLKQTNVECEYDTYSDVFGNVKTQSKICGDQYWKNGNYITDMFTNVGFNQNDIVFNERIYCQSSVSPDYYNSIVNKSIYFIYEDLFYYLFFNIGCYQIKPPHKLETYGHLFVYDISGYNGIDRDLNYLASLLKENQLNKVFDTSYNFQIDENTNIIYEVINEVRKKYKKRTKK